MRTSRTVRVAALLLVACGPTLVACGPTVTAPPVADWRLELEALSARYAVDRDLDLPGRRRLVTLLALQANEPYKADLVAATLPESSAHLGIALRGRVRRPFAGPGPSLPAEAAPVAQALMRWLAGEPVDAVRLRPLVAPAVAALAADPTRYAEVFWLRWFVDPAAATPVAEAWTRDWPDCPDAWLALGVSAANAETGAAALARAAAGNVALAHLLLAEVWRQQGRPSAAQAARFAGWRLAGDAPHARPLPALNWTIPGSPSVSPAATFSTDAGAHRPAQGAESSPPAGGPSTPTESDLILEVLVGDDLKSRRFSLISSGRCGTRWSPLGTADPVGVAQARLGQGWAPARAVSARCSAAGPGVRCEVVLDQAVDAISPAALQGLATLLDVAGGRTARCGVTPDSGEFRAPQIHWQAPAGWRPGAAWDSLAPARLPEIDAPVAKAAPARTGEATSGLPDEPVSTPGDEVPFVPGAIPGAEGSATTRAPSEGGARWWVAAPLSATAPPATVPAMGGSQTGSGGE